MPTTRVYKSSDAGAPTLTGQVGSVTSLLKTLLVGTSGIAFGSVPAAGWTTEYEDVPNNKVAFRNSVAEGGSGCYVRVEDNAVGAGGAKEAYMRTYGSMSDIDTGTDPTPTVAQMARGTCIRKSSTSDATARAWILVADELTFTLQIIANPAVTYEESIYHAGDFESFVVGDAYNFCNVGRAIENSTAGGCGYLVTPNSPGTPASSVYYGMWLARGYASTGSAIPATVLPSFLPTNSTIGGSNQVVADSPPGLTGRLWMPAVIATETSIRGVLRGLYAPLGAVSASTGTVEAAPLGRPVGSNLIVLRAQGSSTTAANLGAMAIESSLEW